MKNYQRRLINTALTCLIIFALSHTNVNAESELLTLRDIYAGTLIHTTPKLIPNRTAREFFRGRDESSANPEAQYSFNQLSADSLNITSCHRLLPLIEDSLNLMEAAIEVQRKQDLSEINRVKQYVNASLENLLLMFREDAELRDLIADYRLAFASASDFPNKILESGDVDVELKISPAQIAINQVYAQKITAAFLRSNLFHAHTLGSDEFKDSLAGTTETIFYPTSDGAILYDPEATMWNIARFENFHKNRRPPFYMTISNGRVTIGFYGELKNPTPTELVQNHEITSEAEFVQNRLSVSPEILYSGDSSDAASNAIRHPYRQTFHFAAELGIDGATIQDHSDYQSSEYISKADFMNYSREVSPEHLLLETCKNKLAQNVLTRPLGEIKIPPFLEEMRITPKNYGSSVAPQEGSKDAN